MNVALHAINGVGLGHLVRAIQLAKEIRTLVPDAESRVRLLVLTNARDTSLLREAGLDFVVLPPRLNEPHADPDRIASALPPPVEDAVLAAIFDAFGPDLVVFDTHAPLALVEHATKRNARTVLVLRELRPKVLASFVASKAARAFDRIVVPHEPGEIDVAPLAGLPHVEVGPIVRAIDGGEPASPSGRESPAIVAIAGGGGQPVDARRYVQAVADAHVLARVRFPGLATTLVTGPYGEAPRSAAIPGLTILHNAADLPRRLAAADLVIAQAGYNAVAEIRALRRPAILVPAYRKAEDQRARARRLAETGAAVLARPEARSIADRIEAILGDPGRLEAMARAHERRPLVPRNREAAEAVLAPVLRLARGLRRVVLVAHDFAPKWGGMETVARGLARSLLGAGVDVRVYTTARLGAASASGLPAGVVRPLFRVRPRTLGIDLVEDLLVTLAGLLEDTPEVVHLCHAGLGPWVPALRAALPAAVTVHVHGNDLLAPWVDHRGAPEAYRDAQIAGLGEADAVLAVSRFSAEQARALGVPSARIRTITNGVDPARFAEAPPERLDAIADRHAIATGDELILTVSRLAPRKGHRTVIRALAMLAKERPRLKFAFTGVSETLAGELAALAAELGVADRLVALGFVPDEDLPALYQRARVFALLSEAAEATDVEGFGVALLEAGASGLPVVASRTGGIPEAVADGETGLLVPPGDPARAASAIARLLDDPDLAARLGQAGAERARTSMSSDAVGDRVHALFHELAAERRSTGRSQVLSAWAAGALAEPLAAAGSATVAGLLRLAREASARLRAERDLRQTSFQKIAGAGGVVRLRATGNGGRLLGDALDDCAALGHPPAVEVKLRRFLEADFLRFAVPRVSAVDLAHAVPSGSPAALLSALQALPEETLRLVRTVRIFASPEARADERLAIGAVPEVHALRRFWSSRGALVVPPPELMRYLSATPAGGPETGMVEPTNLCNLACPTCPTGTGKIPPLPAMPLGRFDQVLGELAPRMKNLALWNYGEPLLNKELPEMIAHAKRAGVRVVKVSSNVHFLDERRGSALLASGLDVLILSLDGASEATYTTFRKGGDFAKVAASVAWLAREKKRRKLTRPRIELQFIVMRHNEHELPEIRRLAKRWGVDALRIKTVGAEEEDTKHLVPAERLYSRYAADRTTPNVRHAFCTMAWDHTVVNVDGSVTPCCYLRPDMGDAFVMGNVFEKPFVAIWRGEKYRAFRQAMLEGRERMPVCNRCRGGTHDLLAAVEEVAPS